MARLASAGPPVRASSIIPSNRPRIETPRRAASASTQARRSWSRRMPTTVDLEVAMAPLTVIRGVYISGAEWWQPGGGHRGGHRFRIGSGPHRQRTEATARHLPSPGSLSDVQRVRAAGRGPNPDAGRRPRGGEWSLTPHPGTHVARALGVQPRRAPLTFIRDLVADSRRCRRGTRRSVGGTSLIIVVLTLPSRVLTKVTDRCAPLRRALDAGRNATDVPQSARLR